MGKIEINCPVCVRMRSHLPEKVNARLPFFGRVVLRVASREYVRAYRSGATALHYMTNSTTLCPGAVRQLLRFGADPNVAEQHAGATALHYAADAGATKVEVRLKEHGTDLLEVCDNLDTKNLNDSAASKLGISLPTTDKFDNKSSDFECISLTCS